MANRDDEAREFCMNFVANSDKYLAQFRDAQKEVLSNFMVKPDWINATTASPYQSRRVYRSRRDKILLKDPETHKLVMTYASKLIRAIFGDQRHEYVQARPTGWEDAATKSPTATKLLKYVFGIQGHFRTFVETVIDMILFGTSIIESPWRYEEREMLVRSVSSAYGVETFDETRLKVPVYDDVCLRTIDANDFFPDPSRYRIQDMNGAAKRFRITAQQAKTMAEAGIYKRKAVETAINDATSAGGERLSSFRTGIDQPEEPGKAQSGFKDMVGYEYLGEIPWNDGTNTRGVITVINNVTVRNDFYPLSDPQLPYHSFIINPTQGRFFGISPAEVVRYDQSFADAIKILLAEAIIRQVHPPIAYDPDSELDVAALQAWKADAPLAIRGGPNSVGTLQYNANIGNGFAMLQGLKMGIQDTSGASGGIQGEPGPARESASVGVQRLQFAMDRPELAGMILENECLPPLALGILRRYQQFLQGTEDLKKRVGELPEPAWLGDIMGDFDVSFFGSRQVASRQMKLQALDRGIAYASVIPAAQLMMPTTEVMKFIWGELLELPEIIAQIGNPQDVMRNATAMQMFGNNAGASQMPRPAQAPGMMPAQASGGEAG